MTRNESKIKNIIIRKLHFAVILFGGIILTDTAAARETVILPEFKESDVSVQNNFKFFTYKSADGLIVEFRAQNNGFDNLDLTVSAEMRNMYATSVLPYKQILPGKSTFVLFQIKQKEKGAFSYNVKYNYFVGIPHAKNTGVYILPVPKGKKFRIDNAFNDHGLHKGKLAHAVDISMSVGTPVYSARDGIVVYVKDDSDEGGEGEQFLEKANYIRILHDDGTYGQYMHLKYKGVSVAPGDKVNSGDLIGYSGNTGYSTGPHLHFDVVAADGNGGFYTVPWTFADDEGNIFEPEQGMKILRKN